MLPSQVVCHLIPDSLTSQWQPCTAIFFLTAHIYVYCVYVSHFIYRAGNCGGESCLILMPADYIMYVIRPILNTCVYPLWAVQRVEELAGKWHPTPQVQTQSMHQHMTRYTGIIQRLYLTRRCCPAKPAALCDVYGTIEGNSRP